VIVYSHGFPASRHEAFVAHKTARDAGFTVVSIDRPGFGGSHWYPDRTIEDWADDVRLIVDRLEVQKFSLMGVSGGTPTAIAAAVKLADRVSSLTIVSGVAPMHLPEALHGMNVANRLFIRLGGVCRPVARWTIAGIATSWRVAPTIADLWFGALLPKSDREIVLRPDVGVIMARSLKEALKGGVRGVVTEYQLLLSKWEGLLKMVRVPSFIWHGDADNYVPLSMGKLLSREIPGCTFTVVPGGGHFMVVDKLPEILKAVV
jgi:pimeloyl-ACP methyl ester carboxylesterase